MLEITKCALAAHTHLEPVHRAHGLVLADLLQLRHERIHRALRRAHIVISGLAGPTSAALNCRLLPSRRIGLPMPAAVAIGDDHRSPCCSAPPRRQPFWSACRHRSCMQRICMTLDRIFRRPDRVFSPGVPDGWVPSVGSPPRRARSRADAALGADGGAYRVGPLPSMCCCNAAAGSPRTGRRTTRVLHCQYKLATGSHADGRQRAHGRNSGSYRSASLGRILLDTERRNVGADGEVGRRL